MFYIHGMTNTRTYNSWVMMRQRCSNKNMKDYPDYGGRGITYDPKWETLLGFIDDMGISPKGYSLERIDPNGNYTKNNCKWIPMSEQSKNRRNTLRYTYLGKTQTLMEWCEEYNIKYMTMRYRLFNMCMDFATAINYRGRK